MKFAWTALVRRELLAELRQGRSLIILALFTVAMFIIVMMEWPEATRFNDNYVFYVSQDLLTVFMGILLIGSGFVIPVLAASSIVIEKEKQTFDFLHTSLISPEGIVFAKIINVLGVFILQIVALLPLLGTVFFLAGIDWVEFFIKLLYILMFAFSCAAAGTCASTALRKSSNALPAGYIFVGVTMLGPLVIAGLCLGILVFIFGLDLEIEASVNIMEYTSDISLPSIIFEKYFNRNEEWWLLFLPSWYQFTAGIIWSYLAIRMLHLPPKAAKADTDKSNYNPVEIKARSRKFPFYIVDPLRRKKTIKDRLNPLLAIELRWGENVKASDLIRLFYVMFIIFALLIPFNPIIWLGITLALTPAAMPGTLGKEYELGNIDMLRMTLQSPFQIIVGKYYSGLVSVAPFLLAALFSGFIMLYLNVWEEYTFPLFFTVNITLVVGALLSTSLALLASTLTRKTSTAMVLSFILNMFVFSAIAIIGLIIVGKTTMGSPAQLLNFISRVMTFDESRRFNRLADHSSFLTTFWIGSMATFTFISAAIVALSARLFKKFHMQDK